MFEYYIDKFESLVGLQMELSRRGAEGWRLHTCDVIDNKYYFVVMDRFIANDDAESGNKEEKDEAMACKG